MSRTGPTYHERPAIKEPTWTWEVPAYFFAGGAAAGLLALGAAAQVVDPEGHAGMVTRSRRLAAGLTLAGAGLLISDLGRPERFLNMLRVFKPTSPLSVGSWVLAAAGGTATGAALLGGRPGPAGALGEACGLAAGAAALPLSGYTGVLIADTAVPVWQRARRSLPALFVASGAASAAGLLQLGPLHGPEQATVRRFALAAQAAEVAAAHALEREVGSAPRVARALREGLSGSLWRASKALGGAALAANVLTGRTRAGRAAAGLLACAGSLTMRYALWRAGVASARDPRATFEPQRARRPRSPSGDGQVSPGSAG